MGSILFCIKRRINVQTKTLTAFESAYLETALWSSNDEDGTPLDDSKYADAEPTPETIERIKTDCDQFISLCEPLCSSVCTVGGRVAHDFWLTRNHHGAGFWDGDYPEPQATQLTELAESFGECDLYIGDDGKIHIA
jgi:hypothetical protein